MKKVVFLTTLAFDQFKKREITRVLRNTFFEDTPSYKLHPFDVRTKENGSVSRDQGNAEYAVT